MSDAFITYSRKDKEFVHKLHQALLDKQRDIWVDFEDIPISAEWLQEVFAGIESANAVIAILSPDFAASTVARQEVEHAVKYQKRLIPILHRDVSPDALHPALASHNWLFFRDTDDFDSSVEQLISTLDTDLDYVKQHTQLLIEAREWEQKGKNDGYLLTEGEVTEAERWLVDGAHKLPPPTPLHVEYITHTRQFYAIRQRATLRNVTLALIGALLLALFALMQYTLARQETAARIVQQQRAENNAQTAVANFERFEGARLTSESLRLFNTSNGNTEVAALLTLRALRRAYSPQADAALQQALERNYAQHLFTGGHTDSIRAVVFTPDNTLVATGGADNRILLWNAVTGEITRQLQGHNGAIRSLAFSSDGRWLLSGANDNVAILWDMTTGQTTARFYGHNAAVNSVAFMPDGQHVVTGGGDGTARIWDIVTRKQMAVLRQHTAAVTSVAVSSDGGRILTGSEDRTVILWDTATKAALHVYTSHTDGITAVAFLPTGRFFVSASKDVTAILWDVDRPEQEVRQFIGHTDQILSINISTDGRYLVTGSADRTARLWDIQSGLLWRVYTGPTAAITGVDFSSDRRQLAVTSADRTVRIWEVNLEQRSRQFIGHAAQVTSVNVSSDGKTLMSTSIDRSIRLWDMATLKQTRRIGIVPSEVYDAALLKDDTRLVVGYADSVVRLIDVYSSTVLTEYKGHQGAVFAVALSPDEMHIASASEDGTVRVWNLASGQTELIIPNRNGERGGPVNSVAFSPDGTRLLTAGDEGSVRLWDSATGQLIRDFDPSKFSGPVLMAIFSPDGMSILSASSGNDTTVRLWKIDGTPIREFVGHTTRVTSLAFSPDGQRIVTGSEDATARVWDVATGNQLRQFAGHTSSIWSVTFSADGQYVVTGSLDRTIRLWEADLKQAMDLLCTNLPRDLSAEDRRAFGVIGDDLTCSKFSQALPIIPTPLPKEPSETEPATASPEATSNATLTPTPQPTSSRRPSEDFF